MPRGSLGLEARPDGLGEPEDDGVEDDGDEGAGEDEVAPFGGEDAQADAEGREDEREFADLREACRDGECCPDRLPEQHPDEEGEHRLADKDDEHHPQNGQRAFDDDRGVEQHAHRHEEQHRERIALRQRFLRGTVGELGLAEDHAGKECTQRKADAEQIGRPRGDTQRDGKHREAEQLAAAGMGRHMEAPWDHPAAHHQHEADKGGELDHRQPEDPPQVGGDAGEALEQIDERIVELDLAAAQ